jgi:hypothetical protein
MAVAFVCSVVDSLPWELVISVMVMCFMVRPAVSNSRITVSLSVSVACSETFTRAEAVAVLSVRAAVSVLRLDSVAVLAVLQQELVLRLESVQVVGMIPVVLLLEPSLPQWLE